MDHTTVACHLTRVSLLLAVALETLFLGWPGLRAADAEVEVFDPGPVLQLRIELPDASRHALLENERAYAPVTVREGEAVYLNVGIKIKGSAGSRRELDQKPGLTLKFDRFVPGRRFRGQRKLHLNNCVQDPSYLSELLGNELFRAAGVPAQRIGFAQVWLDGRDLGLYVVAEGVTRDFLARWFADSSGNLYEGPGDVNSSDLDIDSRGGAAAERSDLEALARAASEPDREKRLERLESILDVDRFLSFLAMEAIASHWDGYAVGVNNFHLYHDPVSAKMVFIPHGTDQLFQQPGAPAVPQAGGLIARAVLEIPAAKRRYRERLRVLLETVFVPEALRKRIEGLAAKIEPYVSQGNADRKREYQEVVQAMIRHIEDRARILAPALEFDRRGAVRLKGWRQEIRMGEAELLRADGEGADGGPALKILATGGLCKASWRTRVLLAPGRYRFAGRVRTRGVEPGPEEGRGAALRISGEEPVLRLAGEQDWTPLEFEIQVGSGEASEDEDASKEVELVSELYAFWGAAWFDEGSLKLVRLPGRDPEAE